jgi:hypothetical protein
MKKLENTGQKAKGLFILSAMLVSASVIAYSLRKLFQSTEKRIYNQAIIEANQYGFNDPDNFAKYVVAMSKLESGNYTNTLSKYDNYFSMREVKERDTVRSGTVLLVGVDGGNYIWQKYSSPEQAVKDLFLWFKAKRFDKYIYSSTGFVQELRNKGYFTANINTYINGVNSYLS